MPFVSRDSRRITTVILMTTTTRLGVRRRTVTIRPRMRRTLHSRFAMPLVSIDRLRITRVIRVTRFTRRGV